MLSIGIIILNINPQISKPNLTIILHNPEKITSGFIIWFWGEHVVSAEESRVAEVILLFLSSLEVRAYFLLLSVSQRPH